MGGETINIDFLWQADVRHLVLLLTRQIADM
jgi:hypothetical protein